MGASKWPQGAIRPRTGGPAGCPPGAPRGAGEAREPPRPEKRMRAGKRRSRADIPLDLIPQPHQKLYGPARRTPPGSADLAEGCARPLPRRVLDRSLLSCLFFLRSSFFRLDTPKGSRCNSNHGDISWPCLLHSSQMTATPVADAPRPTGPFSFFPSESGFCWPAHVSVAVMSCA